MNIVHLTPYYAPAYAFGGVTRAVEGMARALAARGHAVTVLTTDALSQSERYPGDPYAMQDGVRVVRVRNRSIWLRGRFNLSTPPGMRAIAADLLREADVLHVHELRTAENLLVTPVAVRLGVPIALSPHGTLALSSGRGALKAAWDRLLPRPPVAAVIALTAREAEEARAFFAVDPVMIPNGVDADEFAHLPDPRPFRERYRLGGGVVCLFMGRLHARKGVETLVRAFQQADVKGARLLIVGPDEGMLPTLKPLLDARMAVTGYLAGADRLAALAAADVFCLPATGEGLPMAALEALASRLPVILSPDCHLPEVAEAGAGLIVEPQVEPLAHALRDLLGSAERRAAMRSAAQTLARERFSWASVAERLEAVYASLPRTKPARGLNP